MKRFLTVALMLAVILFTGCSSREEKINIIKGAGNANSSLVISFNELCTGTVEGFGAANTDILLTSRNGDKLDLVSFNTVKMEKMTLMSLVTGSNYNVEVSPSGRKVIFNNRLIALDFSGSSLLPPVSYNGFTLPEGDSRFSPYTFINDDDAAITNPYYFLGKYFKTFLKLGYSDSPHFYFASDISPSLGPESFKGIKAPDIDGILKYRLLLQNLKFVFIGTSSRTGESSLYSFDFIERKFISLDKEIVNFSISPDVTRVCYIKKSANRGSESSLYVSSLKGENRMQLAKLPGFSGLAWSSDSQWIAYSGGSENSYDLYVASVDRSTPEQLTHNMRVGGKLAWKGNRIAFTSSFENPEASQKVYIITLNVENAQPPQYSGIVPPNRQVFDQLNGFLKRETVSLINKKSKTE